MKIHSFPSLLLAAGLSILASIPANAQTPSRLLGSVVDPNGHSLPGVTVQLKGNGKTAVTDGSGSFRLTDLPWSARKIRSEDMFQVEGQKLAFHVLTNHARVRITVFDFTGREIARVVDETLGRGLYGIAPVGATRRPMPMGVYGVRLEIGARSYFHRIPFAGKKDNYPGLRPVRLALDQIAKVAAAELDSLLVHKAGYRTLRQQVVVQDDTLPAFVLLPDSLTSWRSDDPAYLRPLAPGVTVTPLLTVGESVPMTGDSLQAYRMGGIPDGLGLAIRDGKTVRLMMNHEIPSTDSIHTLAAGPARRGSYVSEYVLDKADGRILSGRHAFESAYGLGMVAPTPGNFNRFCSGTMAGPAEGLSFPVYLTGEEANDTLTFSPLGPQAVAIFNQRAHILPDFGKMAFENIIPVPGADTNLTLAFALEDGPARESQLYLYVGRKLRNQGGTEPLYENGLAGGKLYVFATSGNRDEGDFKSGTLAGRWVEPARGRPVEPASPLAAVSAATLQAWSAVSADGKDSSFNFDRIEDGAYDRDRKGVFYFATTGEPSAARNRFGRIYKLDFDPADPIGGKPPSLEILVEGDSASGFVSPDNMDIGPDRKLVFSEDFNLAMHRPPAVWMLDLKSKDLRKMAEVDLSAVPAASRPTGLKTFWETSGVIDASAQFGAGAWLINVQAHSVGSAAAGAIQGVPPGVSLVQGGQLVLLRALP